MSPIGVGATGVLEPPADRLVVGWWVSGPRPGGPGRAIITGHIDSPDGLGAFAALDDVVPGDRVWLTDTAGRVHLFQVTDRQQVDKTQLDPAVLITTAGGAVSDVVLVTCIGAFDRSTLSYDSNLLITAVPAAG